MKLISFVLVAVMAAGFASAATAGDPLNIRTLPLLSGQSRQDVAHDFADAGADQSAYTLAVSSTGSWDSIYDARIDPEDRARNVLQRCEHRAHSRCLLVIHNGKATGDRTFRDSGLAYVATFDLTTVPFVPREVMARIGPRFAAAKQHRAMAINANGLVGVAAGRASADEAGRLAVQKCQEGSKGRTCFLYAVDNQVVFTKDTKIY